MSVVQCAVHAFKKKFKIIVSLIFKNQKFSGINK